MPISLVQHAYKTVKLRWDCTNVVCKGSILEAKFIKSLNIGIKSCINNQDFKKGILTKENGKR